MSAIPHWSKQIIFTPFLWGKALITQWLSLPFYVSAARKQLGLELESKTFVLPLNTPGFTLAMKQGDNSLGSHWEWGKAFFKIGL